MKKEKIIKVKLQKDYALVKPHKRRGKKSFEKGEERVLRYAKELNFKVTVQGRVRRTEKHWVKLTYDGFEYTVDFGDERGLYSSKSFDKELDADLEFVLLVNEYGMTEEQI